MTDNQGQRTIKQTQGSSGEKEGNRRVHSIISIITSSLACLRYKFAASIEDKEFLLIKFVFNVNRLSLVDAQFNGVESNTFTLHGAQLKIYGKDSSVLKSSFSMQNAETVKKTSSNLSLRFISLFTRSSRRRLHFIGILSILTLDIDCVDCAIHRRETKYLALNR